MKTRKKLKKKILFFFLLFLLLIVSFFFFFPKEQKKNLKQEQETRKKEEYESPIPALRSLYQNDDIIAEIEIPSIDIKEPIVKGENNDYYLDHDLQKNKKEIGATFIDYRTIDIDKVKQLNIYGHNSADHTLPFSALEQYEQEDFFKNNRNITLKTENNVYSYKIFAVSKVPKEDEEHMIIAYEGEEFLNHVDIMRSNSMFDTKETITKEDSILVLQTCLFEPEQFLLILAKKSST